MKLSYTLEDGYGSGPAIGLIVLSTDETLEPELRQITSEPFSSLYHSRIPFDPVVTKDTLAAMEAQLPSALRLLSTHIQFNAIGYGCTSGATVIGASRIAEVVREFFPDVPVSDPITAVIAACKALEKSKIGLLTPYSLDVSQAMQVLLEQHGISIKSFATFDQTQDHKVARISEQSILTGILELGKSDCDIVFASCTSLRCFRIIDKAEQLLGKPVISSNSAFAWHLYRLAGNTNAIGGPGQLFQVL